MPLAFFLLLFGGSGTVLIMRLFLHSEVAAEQVSNYVLLFIFLFSGWRLSRVVLFFARIRQRGWNVGVGSFLLHCEDLPGGRIAFVPQREEWAALPSWESSKSEIENLTEALYLAQGWDRETRDDRELVTVLHSEFPEEASLVRDVLRDEGFRAVIEDSSHGGVYRFRWSARVQVPKTEAEDALRFISEHMNDSDEDAPAEA